MTLQNRHQLSASFFLHEFLRSQVASRIGRTVEAPPHIVENLHHLCAVVLQPVRDLLARPVVISSGYRPPWLNSMVGGSPTSAHMQGLAADILVVGLTPLEVCRVVAMSSAPLFDQLIFEGSWTHLSAAPVGQAPRRQVLTAKFGAGRVTYAPGLP
jgi:zinc D-Ala-D-Ala carboxypeptidase